LSEASFIAIIEDDRSVRESLAMFMESFGYDVLAFPSAEHFLDSNRLKDSVCLIIDVTLPGMTGVELQSRLKDSGSEVAMIFITAQAHERIRDQALNNGAIAFLEKPFSTEALLRAVDSAGVRTSPDGSLKNSTA